MKSRSLAEIWINPLTGAWPFDGFPDQVEILGRQFRKARWFSKDATVQYRERSHNSSMHMRVKDGRWKIDHIDQVNPDAGSFLAPAEHFLSDTPFGKFLASLAGVVVVVVAGRFLFKATEEKVPTLDLISLPGLGEISIAPRNTGWSKKRERQYRHVLNSCVDGGKKKPSVCRTLAAATVNKQRAVSGEAKTVGAHCPRLTVPLKHDKSFCYNPRTHKRVRRIPPSL